MTSIGKVEVKGLREYTRALKQLDKDLPKAVRVALNDATDIVSNYARQHMPKRSGRAVGTIRAASTQTQARIREGGNRAPYVPWLDFGGRVGRKKSVKRPFYTDGRYLYAGLAAHRDEFTEAMVHALVRVAKDAGLEVD